LEDLNGDIVATASLSETATKLLSTERPTEYGVPTKTTPAKYGWLGGDQRATELPSGVIAMGARSYIPQLGRFLQTDPIPGGSANAYAYVFGDPINDSDPSGEYGGPSSWSLELAGKLSQEEANAFRVAQEEEARRQAEEEALKNCVWLNCATPTESYPGESEPELFSDPSQLTPRTDGRLKIAGLLLGASGKKKSGHHNCDFTFEACQKCPPTYEEFPIGTGHCYPATPPGDGSTGKGSHPKKGESWLEKSVIISGYR
jgi:RHS repeat-associated protein